MGYALGVDLGTTFTAAATARDGRAEIATLGSRAAAVPSVVLVRDAETMLTGEAAERRASAEPDRVAREFKRRVGDTTPIFLAGSPYSAEALMARMLQWVTDEVSKREGGPPERVAVSHPANWGPYKRELLDNAIRQANLENARTITEPEAAAIHYSSTERVDPGDVVAVYDLGGGTFDAAVLRKTADGWETLGSPEGIERLGGIDFDAAVFAHVQRSLGGALDALDEDDTTAMAAVGRLRQECVAAKEALSADTEASIPVLLPSVQTQVRLTRAEFESMIRPQIASSIEALRRALASAAVEPDAIRAVLLVGGSSRIPLVAQMVTADLGRPVNIDVHPKHSIALGAALAAARGAEAEGAAAAATSVPPRRSGAGAAAAAAATSGMVVGAGAAAADSPTADHTAPMAAQGASAPGTGEQFAASGQGRGGGASGGPPGGGRVGNGRGDDDASTRRAMLIGGSVLLAALAVGAGVVVASGSGNEQKTTGTTTSSSTSTSTTTATQPRRQEPPTTSSSTSTTSTTASTTTST